MSHYIRLSSLLLVFALLVAPALQGQGVEELERSTAEADRLLQQAQQSGSDKERIALAEQSLKLARDLRHDAASRRVGNRAAG